MKINHFIIIASLLTISPFIAVANPTSGQPNQLVIKPAVNHLGKQSGFIIHNQHMSLTISSYGQISKVQAYSPSSSVFWHQRVQVKRYPPSAPASQANKIASVNGIRVTYYPCQYSNPIPNQTQSSYLYPSASSIPVNANVRRAYQQIRNHPGPGNQAYCVSFDGNGGKVRSIGSITVSYHTTRFVSAYAGKISRIGNHVINYNSFLTH